MVLQERRARARGRKIENAVAVEIQARKDAVAHALGIEVRIKGIVVLQLVGPIVEIVVVCDQGKRLVQPATHSRPHTRTLEYGEFRIVVVWNVEPLATDVDPVVQGLEQIEVKDRRVALPALALMGGHFEVARAAGKFALDLKNRGSGPRNPDP